MFSLFIGIPKMVKFHQLPRGCKTLHSPAILYCKRSDSDLPGPDRSMGVMPNMLNWALALMKLCLPGGQHITQRDRERLNDSLHEPTKKITLTSVVISAM